ncbi:hypothetical protein ACIP1U_25185 [Cupriavidus sp. NPDC089707]|uniref:hypothetical protein n=1 Tax=Cupriavidus sp. NPDC089707 TaxID=3363963 RepID=UPI00382E80C3
MMVVGVMKVFNVLNKIRYGKLYKRGMDDMLVYSLLRHACTVPNDAVFPVQTDEDVSDLRDWLIVSQTSTRREGGGYLRKRVTFATE